MDWDAYCNAVIAMATQRDTGADELIRLLPVVVSRRQAGGTSSLRTVNRRLTNAEAVRRLRNTREGVFLAMANEQQARQWAQRLAARMGGTVREDVPHGEGLPHFHVDYRDRQGRRTTGHIFYGRPPVGDFFDGGA